MFATLARFPLLRFSLFLILSCVLFFEDAISGEAGPYVPHPATYTSEQMISDYGVFEGALREMHGGLFAYRSEDEMEGVLSEGRRKVARSSTEDELLLVLGEVLCLLGDGHTGTRMSGAAAEFFERQPVYMPLRLRHLGSATFIEHDYRGGDGDLVGSEVLSLNGTPMPDVMETLLRYTPGDGTIESGRRERLNDPSRFGRLLQRVYGPIDSFDLRIRTLDGAERVLQMDPISGPTLDERYGELYPEHYRGRSGGGLSFSDDETVATMRISRFVGDGFPDAVLRWFTKVDSVGPSALILDLRDNGGGLEIFGQQLVGHLVDKPFRLYQWAEVNARSFEFGRYSANNPTVFGDGDVVAGPDGRWRLTPKRRQFLAEYSPLEPRFLGPLVVLVDGGTFSTASDVASSLHRLRVATFVGEETGGSYHGNTSGSTKTIYLPHTKVSVRVPIERYVTVAGGDVPRGRGLIPDETVVPTGSDLRDGLDPALRRAEAIARERARR